MRCLIYATNSDATWVKEYFPGVEPYLLKVVNKPVLEYYIDFAVLLKIQEIRIVSDTSTKEIEDCFQTGEKWGVNLSFSLARPEDTINQILLKNYSFCKEDSVLVMQGFNFIEYDKNCLQNAVEINFEEGSYLDRSLLYINKGSAISKISEKPLPATFPFKVSRLTSIIEYYTLSMDILKGKNSHYVLPGYSNEKDAFFGINFIFPHHSKVIKPIMIGNNVRFQEHTSIGPNAILGDNVIVDAGTTIRDSIIYDNSYVGRELELKEKIVYKNQLMSGLSGDCVQITDKFLISNVDKGIILSYFDKILQLSFAGMIIVIQVLPWLLFYPLVMLSQKRINRKTEFFFSKSYHAFYLDDTDKLRKTMIGKLYVRLSLDKFPLLFWVFRDKLILVGNHIYTTTNQHRKLIKDLPIYQPGVFSLRESLSKESVSIEEFVELEYLNTRCWRSNLKIMINVLFRRFFYGDV